MRRRILVTEGEERSSLAVVRSLGRAGHELIVCSRNGRSLAGASRFASGDRRVPDPLSEENAYLEAVLRVSEETGAEAIIPMTDAACTVLLPARARFGDIRVLGPTAEAYRRISDKAAVALVAERCGIAVPSRVEMRAPGEAAALPLSEELFPAVVKPVRSVSAEAGRRRRVPVQYAEGREALESLLVDAPTEAYPLLIQQRIDGVGVGVFLLRSRGRTLAAFSHRRLREKPPSGGVSVYREAATLDPGLLSACERLLAAYEWEGVAMVELKLETVSAVPYLMEVNGRFWGSLQLAVDAGVDFPALFVAAAFGEAVEPVLDYRVGTRCRWWWGEVDHALAVLRMSAEERRRLGLGARVGALAHLLRPSTRHDRFEVLRREDPRPFMREAGAWVSALIRRA
ncbi:MAG: ATP-grasp domain-containing protein [Gemmatimonadota bacterium]